MKILSIGNSFSQDAQRYLHRLAKREGEDIKAVNLYIGGCPLRQHYLNMLDDNAYYDFEFNGQKTGIKVSIRQALVSDEWDYVTLQQASNRSGNADTYEPYLSALADYVRKYCPKASLLIHQTWAYEAASERLTNVGYETPEQMFADIRNAYHQAAKAIGAEGIIPSGEAMLAAVHNGISKIHRDTFHASIGAGRYLLALTWYKTLTGNDVTGNAFDELDEPITEQERQIIIQTVNDL